MKRGRPTKRAVAERERRARERAALIVQAHADAGALLQIAATRYVAAKKKARAGKDRSTLDAVRALEGAAERFTDAKRRLSVIQPIPLPADRSPLRLSSEHP